MNRRLVGFGGVAAVVCAVVALQSGGGDVQPPAGPIGSSGPSLTEIDSKLRGIGDQFGALGIGGGAGSGVEIYVEIDGIPGEATTMGYENWIEARSAGMGAMRLSVQGGGGQPVSEVSPLGICVEHIDIAFPLLFEAVTTGDVIPSVTVAFVRPGGQSNFQFARLEFEMGAVVDGLWNNEDDAGYCFSIAPAKRVRWTYWPQEPDGSAGPPVMRCFDVQANTTCQ